jgi:UDP-N-acetylmuramoylalanine--D-glutamate ligase
MDWENFFKGKKVTQIGLGLLGRGVDDADFISDYAAELIITDIKNKDILKPSIDRLAHKKNIKFVLGGHRLEDFRDRDFILKGAGIPLDSVFISEAKKNDIPIKMDASLFSRLVNRNVTIVGVTGTRGKSTTTVLIYEILKKAGKRVFLGGNVLDRATLPLLRKVESGDYVVLELDSWQLQGFGDEKISPHIAVFTTFMRDHLNYYGGDMDKYFSDKANIYRYQNEDDFLIVGEDIEKLVETTRSKKIIARREKAYVPMTASLLGEHNKLNISCAFEAAKALGIKASICDDALMTFRGLKGRLEFLKVVNGVTIINDNHSTTPDATIAGLRALGDKWKKKIVLIFGGDDKGLPMEELISEIPKWCSKVVMFKERGTDKIKDKVFALANSELKVYEEEDLEKTVKKAMQVAESGEVLLYSPAFSSFGKWFKNEYDRGDQFKSIIADLD